MIKPENIENNSDANAVTGTDADTHTDLDQANLLAGLGALDNSLIDLQKAGMMDKGKKAEAVVSQARECIAQNIFATHKLKNEVSRLDEKVNELVARLEHYKTNGFGG